MYTRDRVVQNKLGRREFLQNKLCHIFLFLLNNNVVFVLLYLHVYKPHIFDKNLPYKIGVQLIHGILFFLKLQPPKKAVILSTTEPVTPVLYVVKPPVETISD
jgi:hypothetical protein